MNIAKYLTELLASGWTVTIDTMPDRVAVALCYSAVAGETRYVRMFSDSFPESERLGKALESALASAWAGEKD